MSTVPVHERMVLDVGAGEDPHPEANATADIRDGVGDFTFDAGREEWPLETASVDKVIARHVVEHLEDPTHFFDEAARVLVAEGALEIHVPLGENAITDLDHKSEWKFNTPLQYCQHRQRAWDPETKFVLGVRDVDVWLGGPLAPFSPLLQVAAVAWPAWAVHRCFAGELRAVYRRSADA